MNEIFYNKDMKRFINDNDRFQSALFSEALEDCGLRGDTLES